MSGHAYGALLGIGIPTCLLFSGSAVLLSRDKTVSSFLQLLGAGCLMVVVLTHIFETFHLLPWMHWGPGASLRSYVSWTGWPVLRRALVLRHPVDEQRISHGEHHRPDEQSDYAEGDEPADHAGKD